MKKIDIRSFLIGVLGTTLTFVLIGADELENRDGNLGDIVVNSITIRDDGHGGFITAYNQDQKKDSDIVSLSKLQSDLLDAAWDLLKEGGTLLYCTCSLEKEEGEHQIENFIKRKKNSLLDKINNNEINKKLNVSNQNKWLRIFPNSLNYEGGNDGFFIARIKKIT